MMGVERSMAQVTRLRQTIEWIQELHALSWIEVKFVRYFKDE